VYRLDYDEAGWLPILPRGPMRAPSFIPISWGSKQLLPQSMFLDPCLPHSEWRSLILCSRLGNVCMNPHRLLSLGNDRRHYRIQSPILSDPCLHATAPLGQLLGYPIECHGRIDRFTSKLEPSPIVFA
jgi:hypothetical protein